MNDNKYEAILHRARHRSPTRPTMSLWDRAAQFAPFSALSGHAEGAAETARTTQTRRELCEDAAAELDAVLYALEQCIAEQPEVSVTYFRPDTRKDGGDYPTATGRLKRIDHHRRVLIFTDRREIAIDEMTDIKKL